MSDFFDHSLPALKFCYKIRQCINKNLIKLKEKRSRKLQDKENADAPSNTRSNGFDKRDKEDFTNNIAERVDRVKEEIINANFQDFNVTTTLSTDENEFENWYKAKMKEITMIMDDLVKESKVCSYSRAIESFIKDKSEE